MQIIASEYVIGKIFREHAVTLLEVEEAMYMHGNKYIIDNREKNITNPPTVWFISETLDGRILKVVIIPDEKRETARLRTAYEPNAKEIQIYEEKR